MDNAPRAHSHVEALPRTDRLRRRSEFLGVQREGRRVHTAHFLLVVRPSAHQRVGITVTRRVANAVGRNRVKRLAREVFRRNRTLFPAQSDVVFVARRGAPELSYEELRSEVVTASPALFQAIRRAPHDNPQGGEKARGTRRNRRRPARGSEPR